MKPSICFVSLKNYAVLAGDRTITHVGGAEVQQALIARELARRGYPVSFVVLDYGQPDGEVVDGITIYKAYRPRDGIRGLRFVYPRLVKLWSAMKRANADIYYQRGAELETGLVASWCRRHGRRFVFGLAHDRNCDPSLGIAEGFADRLLYPYGLRRADRIIAQTKYQQHLLREGFNLDSVLVRSCCSPMGEPGNGDAALSPQAGNVLWVGRLSPEKQPDWLLQLIQDVPAQTFEVIGDCNLGSQRGEEIKMLLQAAGNVVYRGYVPRAEMVHAYRRARILLSTSESEGFPNVFLEAWLCGVPVLTVCDPDGLVKAFGLGKVVSTCGALAQSLRCLDVDREFWEACATRCQAYVEQHHNAQACVTAFEQVLLDMYSASADSTVCAAPGTKR